MSIEALEKAVTAHQEHLRLREQTPPHEVTEKFFGKNYPDEKTLLKYAVACAAEGSPWDARKLLEVFAARACADKPIEPEIMRYMGRVIQLILDGMEPKQALGLTKSRGRPPENHIERDLIATLAVIEKRAQGKTRDAAIIEVSNDMPMSYESVKQAYDRLKHYF